MIPLEGIAEPVACLSHSISGLIFCLAVLGLLPRILRGARRRATFASYVFGVAGMFFASGAYHFVDVTHPLHGALKFLDHGMIWFAIAGSASMYVVLWSQRAPRILGALWGIAISGLIMENLLLEDLPAWVSPLLYIAMGWVGVFPVVEIIKAEGLRFASPIVAGGAASTLGGLVDAIERPSLLPRIVEAHEVMHGLIASGMFFFLWGLYRCLDRFDEDLPTDAPLGAEPEPVRSLGAVEAHLVSPTAGQESTPG